MELDKSLEQANRKNATGIDGISYKFIDAFWNICRKPLFNCAKNLLENQSLLESFMTAQIKLIPKRGT